MVLVVFGEGGRGAGVCVCCLSEVHRCSLFVVLGIERLGELAVVEGDGAALRCT